MIKTQKIKEKKNLDFLKEFNLFGKKIILKFQIQIENVLSLWMEYEGNVIYSTLVFNNKIENKNTHFTVYYKENYYSHSKYANNKSGKTEKEILLSRLIDRSLRPFLKFIDDKDINLTVMLLDGKKDHQLTKMLLWSGALLLHSVVNENILNNLYSGNILMEDGSYFITSINDDGIIMLEGNFNSIPLEKIKFESLIEEQKIFKEIYESIPTIGLLKIKKDDHNINKNKKDLKYIRFNNRKYDEIRPLNIVMKPLKLNSVIFTRGETSVLGILSINQNEINEISVNYRFHPFSVGENGETFGNSRREKGHSDFVKNSLKSFWRPGFSYKMTGEVLSCSGSSSQATLCATSLCLANEFGENLVSGITVGKINNNIIVDLSAEEDQISDCDLKVVSDKDGLIYGLFMDTKNIISFKDFYSMIQKAEKANKKIIKYMASHISGYRELISVKKSKLGSVVGKNGSNMKEIQKILNCYIKVFENGFVLLNGQEKKSFDLAKKIIESFNKVEDGAMITAIVYAIKEIDLDNLNVNLGIFNFNINKKLFKKYKVGSIITGTILIQDKNISLEKIKNYNFLKNKL